VLNASPGALAELVYSVEKSNSSLESLSPAEFQAPQAAGKRLVVSESDRDVGQKLAVQSKGLDMDQWDATRRGTWPWRAS
jgi:hypothetical protein